MVDDEDDLMKGFTSIDSGNWKRLRENDELVIDPAKSINSEWALRLSLVNNDDNFIDINWIKVTDFLNSFSKCWSFLAFGTNHKSVIINGGNHEDTIKFNDLSEIKIDTVVYPIICEELKSLPKKGIIYNKILTNSETAQIQDALKDQGVMQIHRIQKTNSFNGQKFFTGSIILNFEDNVPAYVKISKINIPVNPLSPRPMLCIHCGILGHTKVNCFKNAQQFCENCFHTHDSGEKCILLCKQCKGDHYSNDFNCKILIRELQILKVKEDYNINYFDARSIISSINPPSIIDPLEDAREKIKDLINKNNSIFRASATRIAERDAAWEALKVANEEIHELKEALVSQKEEFGVEIADLGANMKKNQEQLKDMLCKSDDNFKRFENLSIAHKKLNKEFVKLKEDNTSNLKYIEEFVNSSEVVKKAYISFAEKKTGKAGQASSLEIKVQKVRNDSKERNPSNK